MEHLLPCLGPFPPVKIMGEWLFCLLAVERLPYASFVFVLFRTTYGKTVINLQCHYYGIKTDASL